MKKINLMFSIIIFALILGSCKKTDEISGFVIDEIGLSLANNHIDVIRNYLQNHSSSYFEYKKTQGLTMLSVLDATTKKEKGVAGYTINISPDSVVTLITATIDKAKYDKLLNSIIEDYDGDSHKTPNKDTEYTYKDYTISLNKSYANDGTYEFSYFKSNP